MVSLEKRIQNAVLGRDLVRHMDERDATRQRGLTRQQYQAMMPNNIQWGRIPPPGRSRHAMPYGRPPPLVLCPHCHRTSSSPGAMLRRDHHPYCLALQHPLHQRQRGLMPRPPPGHRRGHHHHDDDRWEDEDNNIFYRQDDEHESDEEEDELALNDDLDDDGTDYTRRSYPRHRPGHRRHPHRGFRPQALPPPYRGRHRVGVGMPPGYGYDDPYAMDGGYQEGIPYGYSDNETFISW
ncbi:MAG: hypothetical protein Q9188_003438 [Gyalolechia gomerana]